ncbi:MAG: RNP-1 like protein RNA-binding protein [uncultured bacterium]|nr:MAG: RNP-1 like protein RNA-binding protein [uncultured bacterium]
MSKKLYIGNLLYEITEDDLKEYFGQAGSVASATVIRFQDGKSKGFAFVEMETEEAAQKAIDTLNGQDYKGRKIVVAEARPPQPRENRFRGGNSRDSRDSRGGGFYRRDR